MLFGSEIEGLILTLRLSDWGSLDSTDQLLPDLSGLQSSLPLQFMLSIDFIGTLLL